jgi:nucleolar GTP-binding protein
VSVPNMKLTHVDTGAFKTNLPDVFVGQTHYRRALRSLVDVVPDRTMKNIRDKNRKYAAQSLDTLMKALTGPLTETLLAYKKTMKSLHPFEATVANLTVIARKKKGLPHLNKILKDVALLRKETSTLAKFCASEANKADSIKGARETLERGKDELRDLYESSPMSTCLSELYDLQKELRRIPVIELKTPSVVLVGAPNVGKSSLVRELSTGEPEVNDYPFTTRGVTIGHIIDDSRIEHLRFQVMDTPGLLDRPEKQRNEMEKLTYASMAHLPTAVVFVIDPTDTAGDKSNLQAQLNVRAHMKNRFPQRPWIDVVSKVCICCIYAAYFLFFVQSIKHIN